jgi:hypothetical protein
MVDLRIANRYLIEKHTGKIHPCDKYKREVKFMWLRKGTRRGGL